MKRNGLLWLCVALVSLLSYTSMMAQNDEISQQQADKLNSLTFKLAKQGRYEDAIKSKERELAILKTLYGERDRSYIKEMGYKAKLYYRNSQPVEAENTMVQVLKLYAESISGRDTLYATYLDNLSLYQASQNKYDDAFTNSKRALEIYDSLKIDSYDLAVVLMHLAEASHYKGLKQDALKYETRSLIVTKKTLGEHSDEYINELPYLKKYYLELDDQKNAQRIDETISRLQEEKKNGYEDLPEPIEFKSVEECAAHNDDALKCIAYYLTHTLNAPNMNQAAQYILNWSTASGDVNILFGEELSVLATSQENLPYFIGFSGAYSYYSLIEKKKILDEDLFIKAIDALLAFYEPNSKLSGKVDLLEKYLQLKEKGKLEKHLRKTYQKDMESYNKSK